MSDLERLEADLTARIDGADTEAALEDVRRALLETRGA